MEGALAIKQVATREATKRRPSIDGSSRKILRALLAFSTECPRHSAETLSEQISVPLSSTYRYIGILREAELIDEDGRGSYVLTPRVIDLAQAARAGIDLPSIARPHMKRLALDVGETVILLQRSGDRAVCIGQAQSQSRAHLPLEIGTALPLHRGAGPKLLLAYQPTAEIEQLLDDIVAHDPGFSVHRRTLIRELTTIRAEGWSESQAEFTPQVYAVAVGIHDGHRIAATISLVAPAFRTPKASQIALRDKLQRTAALISKAYLAVNLSYGATGAIPAVFF